MRNPILAVAIAFVLTAPSSTLAEDKNKQRGIEVQDYSFGVSMPVTTSRSGSGGSPRDISSGQATGKRQYKPVTTLSGPGSGTTAGKPLNTTVQSNGRR